MVIKTQSLTARALDWAVGEAIGYSPTISGGKVIVGNEDDRGITHMVICEPTTNWGQLGPLIDVYGIKLCPFTFHHEPGGLWTSEIWTQARIYVATGRSPQIAACRAIVAARIGDQVDVPEVLC